MQIYRTSRLTATAGAEHFVNLLEPVLRRFVEPVSSDAIAVWDVRQLTDGRNLYHRKAERSIIDELLDDLRDVLVMRGNAVGGAENFDI